MLGVSRQLPHNDFNTSLLDSPGNTPFAKGARQAARHREEGEFEGDRYLVALINCTDNLPIMLSVFWARQGLCRVMGKKARQNVLRSIIKHS